MAKKVAVICGAGIATSTYVAGKLEQLCKERGLDVHFSKGLALEADRLVQGADLIVATTPITKDYGIPVVMAVSFLTGIGEEETIQQILSFLSE